MTTRKGNEDFASNVPFKKPKLQTDAVSNAWGDDSDDDLILLASQVVEQTAGTTTNHLPTNFQSFMSEFEKDSRTSTQNPPIYEISSQDSPPNAVLSVNLAMRAKVSTTRVLTQNKASQDFLRRRIETLEKDKSKASEECQSVLEKLQIKDYELSTLKYELKEMQKVNSDLRMKLVRNGQIEKEIERNKNLERLLLKTEADLQLKNLELVKFKSDRRMSTQIIEVQSIKLEPPKVVQPNFFIDIPSRFQTLRSDSWQSRFVHRVFENSPEIVGRGSTVFDGHLKYLQGDLGLILLGQEVDVAKFVERIVASMELAVEGASGIESNIQHHSSKHRSRRNFLPGPMEQGDVTIFDKS